MQSINQIDYIGNELELFKNATNWKRYFSKQIIPYISGDVLEVGAGIGINTQYLAQNKDTINSWTYIEPDKDLAGQIAANTSELKIDNSTIINGIITDIEGTLFDSIIYIDVLEHIEESKKEIEEIKKRLKPNGHLIILVPAYNFLYNNFDKKIGHFRRYNQSMLLNEVDNSLEKKKLFYLDSTGFFASLANKWFLKKELPTIENVNLWDKFMVPISYLSDRIFFRSFGKSLIGVFQNNKS